MKTNRTYFLKFATSYIGLALLSITMDGYSQPTETARKLVATGVTLQDVRMQILSTDKSTGITEVRFSGQDCSYCDDTYFVDETTRIQTADYQGPMDLDLAADLVFIRATARVIRADKWVEEVWYVDIER